jgi:hypothetical protein
MKNLLLAVLLCAAAGCCLKHRKVSVSVLDRRVRDVFPYLAEPRRYSLAPYNFADEVRRATNAGRFNVLDVDTITVLHRPEDRVAEVGTHVEFVVAATNTGALIQYQWYKWTNLVYTNRTALTNQTNNVLVLNNVTFDDVAGYEVILSQNGVPKTNLLANLTVQYIYEGSLQGAVRTPLTAFYPSSWKCSSTDPYFTYSCTPNDGQVPYLFFGQNIDLAYQTGPARNYGARPWITITTYTNTTSITPFNHPCDTALELFNNGEEAVPAQPFRACNNDVGAGYPDPDAARIQHWMGFSSNLQVATYRPVIYYRSPSPAAGPIYWEWKYHY